MMSLFHKVSQLCSRITTEEYSTSFASAIRLLHKDLQAPIYNVYGFVRFADEINNTLLVNQYKDGNDYYKLMPTQVDRPTFENLINGNPNETENQITRAYIFFEKKLKTLKEIKK